jgi:hypothetical protein
MSMSELAAAGIAITVIGGLAVAFELSPLARTRFAKNWVYGAATRRASRLLSFAVFAFGMSCLGAAAIWSLLA